MIAVSTEERFALTMIISGTKFTLMYTTHAHLMMSVNYYIQSPTVRFVSVETLESAIRADALARGLW